MIRNCRRQNYNYSNMPENYIENSCPYIEDNLFTNVQNECECGFNDTDNTFPLTTELGQSYVPFQNAQRTFTPEVGLQMGTIFPELVSTYQPCQSLEENAFIAANNTQGGCNNG